MKPDFDYFFKWFYAVDIEGKTPEELGLIGYGFVEEEITRKEILIHNLRQEAKRYIITGDEGDEALDAASQEIIDSINGKIAKLEDDIEEIKAGLRKYGRL